MIAIKRRIDNIPIFPKLVLTFLIITLPLFTLSLVLNDLGKQEVKNQISSSITMNIHYYFTTLEKELERIIRNQQGFINDEDLIQLSNSLTILSDYQRTKTINDLKLKLTALKESSIYIKNISVYIRSLNGTVSTSSLEEVSGNGEEAEAIAKATYTSGIPITVWQDRLFLNLTYPLNLSKTEKEPQFIQNIELSMEALTGALNSFPQEGGALLFNDKWQIANDKYTSPQAEIREALTERMRESTAFTMQVDIGKQPYMAVYEKSTFLDASLLFYFPENVVVGQLKTYGVWFWLLVASSFIIVVLFSYGIYLLIHRPLQNLVRRFRSVEAGDFSAVLSSSREDEFGYIFNRFERTVLNLKTLIDELYVQKIRLQQSELKQLQMQITPHFLYNSFFILHRLIKNDENETAELISKNLGDYFHYITRNGLEEVPLEHEVNHVRSYVEIQNVRFSSRIVVDFDPLPPSFHGILIPRLILQPLVENAYEHGLGEVVREGRLSIRFAVEADKLIFSVEDNGAGLTQERLAELNGALHRSDEGETTGLINIHRRLKLKYGERGGLEIGRGSMGGARVRIYIPSDKGEQI
ncbi:MULTISPECIES: sensor histidine kinase [Cohnella]|uniref:histidine kinase n=1 Tax=Cohnella phaseoli TaxID=456490 RepID=A0A3D9KH80_9BACL|nr:histidine kinase [Cohnella phaseoli]RED85240.1 two-component system sensor histidine kinase YesM [Cohnella phaseoli]